MPLTGLRSASFVVSRATLAGAGGFLSRHHRWARESGIRSSDRSTFEHEVISLALHHGATWDRLNLRNLAISE
eukprot:1144785-Heterocapsa_arctica.AAC.1